MTNTLLENRNIAKNLEPIPEVQAIRYLGPLAFEMQETGNSFTRKQDVIHALTRCIPGGSDEEKQREAEKFLLRMRKRGGLFVQRTGDYFGFMHRTFQEYFAARYVLNQVKLDQPRWIHELVERARRQDELWREPFLLAVAYQSTENELVANDILRALLNAAGTARTQERERDLLLAAECVVEAKPLTIDTELQKQLARSLLQAYMQAQKERRFDMCRKIENAIRIWLLSLPKELPHLPLYAVLLEAVSATTQTALQRATLTLLTMIVQQLQDCAQAFFDMLIPPLLALAGLPAIGTFNPAASNLKTSPDFNVADLALTALSFMDKRGPAGVALERARQYFNASPEHLRLLARYSLECGTLLTLAAVPFDEGTYRRYEAAIARWLPLRDTKKSGEREIESCLSIHHELLACAEEASYPTSIHLLQMLNRSAGNPTQPWQHIWQNYLLDQVNSGYYIDYQECILLWSSLFPQDQEVQHIAQQVVVQYRNADIPLRRCAQRFIATLAYDLRDMQDM